MSGRTTALLLLICAVLGGFVWWYEIRGGERRAEAEAASKRVFGELEADAVTALELREGEGEVVRLERREDGWRLLAPVDFPADDAAVNGVASALAALDSEAAYDDPAPPEEYGLGGEPALRFETSAGRFALRIGDETPLGGNTYVAGESGKKVWVVPTWRTSGLKRSAFDLRDKRLLHFDRDAVRAIRLAWPGGGVRLEREGESWRLHEPFEGPADERSVRDLLSDLAFLRATGFVDAPPQDPAEVGLADPELSVTLELEGEASPPAELAIGALREQGMRIARGRAQGVLYEIPAERLEDFPRRVGAWRYRELARYETGDAQRIELAFQDPEAGQSALIEGTRDADGAWSTRPEAMDASRIAVLVSELSHLRAEDVAADALGADELAALELSPPRVHVRVWGEGEAEAGEPDAGALLAEVRLGRADPTRGVAAQRADRDTVFWLDYALAEQIPVSLDAFRNRFLAEPEPESDAGGEPPSEGAPPAAPE